MNLADLQSQADAIAARLAAQASSTYPPDHPDESEMLLSIMTQAILLCATQYLANVSKPTVAASTNAGVTT